MKAGIISFGAGASPATGKEPKRSLSQGSQIVRNSCIERGFDVVDLCERWQKVDVLMVSLFWWEHAYELVRLLANRGIPYWRKDRGWPVVFVGGGLVSYNPAPLRDVFDLACIGDGEEAAPAALDAIFSGRMGALKDIQGIYVSEDDNRATWQHVDDVSATIKWPFYDQKRKRSKEGVDSVQTFVRRLEVARGCKRACFYCALGWTKKYREVPTDLCVKAVIETKGAVKAFGADPSRHSGWPEISDAYDLVGKFNQARDISSTKILSSGFEKSRVYSTGIDGLSERIRAAVAKPLKAADIKKIIELANGHMGSIGMYMILDLPGESDADFVEWFETLASVELEPTRKLSKIDISRGFSAERFYAIVTLNAFSPTPHTPLQWAGINRRRNLTDDYMGFIDIMGDKERRPLKHKLLGRANGATSRTLETLALRCGPQAAPLIVAIAGQRGKLGKNGFRQIDRLAKRLGVLEHLQWALSEKGQGDDLPWRKRVKTMATDAKLARGWAAYKKTMGIG